MCGRYSRFPLVVSIIVLVGLAAHHPTGTAQAQEAERAVDAAMPAEQPGAKPEVKNPTEVMVLATPHLESLGGAYDPTIVVHLIEVLHAWGPRVVCVEAIPPSVIGDMEQRGGAHAEALDTFAGKTLELGRIAQKKVHKYRQEAEAKATELLDKLPKTSQEGARNALRLRAVSQLLAAYDYHSALLQWAYLRRELRINTEMLPLDVVKVLEEEMSSANERVSIGVQLAKSLGLQRIACIDDHMDKDLFGAIAPKLTSELVQNPLYDQTVNSKLYADAKARLLKAADSGDLLEHYLYLNSPEYTTADVDTQWGLFLRTNLPSGLDRSRLALWEVRNLNMTSHIRRASAMHPGKRILVIVGGGHKPFLDDYLGRMMDVKLVNLADIAPKAKKAEVRK
jgi:hypothetical protein